MRELASRTAVVTGGAGAIRYAMAAHFAAAGMRIVLADVEQGALDSAAAKLAATGAEVLASYSVAKQGVVAISEALLHQLADHPIGVSVLCPGAVRSGIGTSERNRPGRPADAPELERDHPWAPETIEADEVGALVVAAVRDDRFWIFPHEHYVEQHRARAETMSNGTSPVPPVTPR